MVDVSDKDETRRQAVATGRVLVTTADAAGRFTFTGLQASSQVMQLSASAQLGQRQVVHYALLPGLATSGTANVTPLTTAIAALAGPTSLPADLESIIAERLRVLPSAERDLLEKASACGEVFWVGWVTR
jgi:hypothetical protein